MKLTGENRSIRGKTCPSATLSTTNPTWKPYRYCCGDEADTLNTILTDLSDLPTNSALKICDQAKYTRLIKISLRFALYCGHFAGSSLTRGVKQSQEDLKMRLFLTENRPHVHYTDQLIMSVTTPVH
jgi:hypothetical protein